MMKKIELRSISSSVNLARQASRALPSIFPFFMNSATNTQETANVQTEIVLPPSSLYQKPFVGTTRIIQSVTTAISVYCIRKWPGTMKLDDWLTRLVAVPPGRSPLANGLAIGMRIALFILIPLGIIALLVIVLLHR
jgi:hypothetical protein